MVKIRCWPCSSTPASLDAPLLKRFCQPSAQPAASLSFAPRRRRSCCASTAESACGLAFEHALPRSRHGRAVVAQGRRRHVARVRGRRARRAVRAPPPCGTSDAAWSGHVVTTTQSLSHVTSRCRPCTSYPSLLPLRRSTRACSAASVCFSSARRSVVVHARNHNGKRSQRLAQITNLISTESPRASASCTGCGQRSASSKSRPGRRRSDRRRSGRHSGRRRSGRRSGRRHPRSVRSGPQVAAARTPLPRRALCVTAPLRPRAPRQLRRPSASTTAPARGAYEELAHVTRGGSGG